MNNILIELLVLDNNTWNPLTVCKQMSSDTFTNNVIYKLFAYKLCMHVCICVNKQDLVLNTQEGLICHKT